MQTLMSSHVTVMFTFKSQVPQDLVVKYNRDLPHSHLVTLHVQERRGKRASIYSLLTQPLGTKAVGCSLPGMHI